VSHHTHVITPNNLLEFTFFLIGGLIELVHSYFECSGAGSFRKYWVYKNAGYNKIMTQEIVINSVTWLRRYWWVFWCLLLAYSTGRVAVQVIGMRPAFPPMLYLWCTVGFPIVLSKSVAMCFLRPTKTWHIIGIPALVAALSVYSLWPVHVYVLEHHFPAWLNLDQFLVLKLSYLLTLLLFDVVVLAGTRSLNRKVIWAFTAIDLALMSWLGNFLGLFTNY
jgi:hypothetical protein